MLSWHSYHRIALVLGTILRTIDYVYLQLPSGNRPLAELNTLQSEHWGVPYPMTSVMCAPSTARRVANLVGWLPSWDIPRTTPFAPRWMKSKWLKWCVMQSNARRRKVPSPRWINLVLRLLIHKTPGGCARWRLGHCVFVNQRNKVNQEIAATRVYIYHLPAYTSIFLSSHIEHTTSILNNPNIMWLVQNNASCSKTHPITYTTLYIPPGLPSATCNCILMLIHRM